MNILTLVTFAVSYIVWLAAWVHFGEWQPRRNPFIVADVLYATGTVMAFLHFTYIFQVSSTLGPLQLSLYRMLKDIYRFLIIYLMLFLAFGTGLVKIYSYYVSSLHKIEDAINPSSHHVARYVNNSSLHISVHERFSIKILTFLLKLRKFSRKFTDVTIKGRGGYTDKYSIVDCNVLCSLTLDNNDNKLRALNDKRYPLGSFHKREEINLRNKNMKHAI